MSVSRRSRRRLPRDVAAAWKRDGKRTAAARAEVFTLRERLAAAEARAEAAERAIWAVWAALEAGLPLTCLGHLRGETREDLAADAVRPADALRAARAR